MSSTVFCSSFLECVYKQPVQVLAEIWKAAVATDLLLEMHRQSLRQHPIPTS
jgi:hypothetical protein